MVGRKPRGEAFLAPTVLGLSGTSDTLLGNHKENRKVGRTLPEHELSAPFVGGTTYVQQQTLNSGKSGEKNEGRSLCHLLGTWLPCTSLQCFAQMLPRHSALAKKLNASKGFMYVSLKRNPSILASEDSTPNLPFLLESVKRAIHRWIHHLRQRSSK